ncbi:25268_t:CDS:2, partial [Gigaspora margarita]
MSKHINTSVTLLALGSIVDNLHYGPYSCFWWYDHSNSNLKYLIPICVGQKTCAFLNGRKFLISVVVGNSESLWLPGWVCELGEYSSNAEMLSTKAVSSIYSQIFKTHIRYSGYTAIGLDDNNIINQICQDIHFFPIIINIEKYKVFVFGIGKKQAIFVSQILENKYILDIHQFDQKIHTFSSNISPNDMWKQSRYIQKIEGCKLFGLCDTIVQYAIKCWALKKNQKSSRGETVRITETVKALLEKMFLAGNIESRKKLNAQEMQQELLYHVEQGEIEESEIPK